jgi:hypothetical protein
MAEAHVAAGAHPQSNIAEVGEFGAWTGHQIPEDRSGWHPLVRRFYEYWLSVAPPDRLPGRQHIRPEDLVPLLSRLWMLDVHRNPLRFRYRLAGTDIVRGVHRELTGEWLDEVQPKTITNPLMRDRHRFVAEMGSPTWRRGPILWDQDPTHRTIENCVVPLAADGVTVDKIFAVSVAFDSNGREI